MREHTRASHAFFSPGPLPIHSPLVVSSVAVRDSVLQDHRGPALSPIMFMCTFPDVGYAHHYGDPAWSYKYQLIYEQDQIKTQSCAATGHLTARPFLTFGTIRLDNQTISRYDLEGLGYKQEPMSHE